MGKDPFYQLELAQKYLDEGLKEKAQSIVLIYSEDVPSDAEICFKWARLCEELGLARKAIEFYRKAIKLSPNNSKILYYYASLLNDIGYYEDSIHYLKKAVKNDPDHEAARKLLSEVYQALGLYGQAEALYPQVQEEQKPIRYFPPTISKEHVERVLVLFSGREIGYAIQSINNQTGEITYEFKNLPISYDLISQHINGEITLLVYPLRSDKTVKYTAIEVRIRDRILKENIKNQGYLKYLEEKALSYVISLRKLSEHFGIPSYIDYSGGFSFRVWFFFREFVHFLKAREFLKRFLEHAPTPDTYLVVDPFIGTKGVGIGWKEHHIMLPFGINRATKRRALFLDEEGNPYPEQLTFLKKIQEIPFKESLSSIKGSSYSYKSISEEQIDPIIEDMISSCPVLSEIINKAKKGRILAREEKIILFYTIGILDENGKNLHFILSSCPDYNYTKVERQRVRLKPNPISCIKIRELVPELTASLSCNCTFDLRGGRYPSPVMHINPYLVPPRDELEISDDLPLREAARRYISLKRQKAEIDMAIQKTSKLLEKYYSRTKKETIHIDGLILYRKKEGNRVEWEIKV